jgi:3'(2'), 5'-bisphosphate nucleotidase
MKEVLKNIKIKDVMNIAQEAGELILQYQGKVGNEEKQDGSPVTIADKEASEIIINGLQKLWPNIPVVSEEASLEENLEAMKSPLRWVVDPLDGTRTFIHGRKGYGVHIGLVQDGEPVKGVVFFPAKGKSGRFYFTGDDGSAYKQEGVNVKPEKIQVNKTFAGRPLKASVHYKEEKRPKDIGGHFYEAVYGVGGGRICNAAEGKADVAWMMLESKRWAYSSWDVAAAQAVLKAAGGDLFDPVTKKAVRHDNKNFAVPGSVGGHPDVLKEAYLLR